MNILMRLDVDLAVTDTQDITQDILWQDMNSFIQQELKASPKITYSKYSTKPGWNVKYQKSDQTICTLYPEKEGFSALVVFPQNMVPLLDAISGELEPEILEIIKSAIPLNDTLWLMIRINRATVLKNVKQLLQLKEIICG